MAKIKTILYFTIIAVIFASANAVDYCKLKSDCTNERLVHTMCKFKSPKPGSRCGNHVSLIGLTQPEEKAIVEKHNELRRKVASGDEKRGKNGKQPAAVHMPDVSWDDELATIAQRWTNQCYDDHEDCNDVERFAVGQNIALTKETRENKSTLDELILQWYDEVVVFDKDEISSYPDIERDEEDEVGHYTQLVWADSTKIGCGRIKYRNSENEEVHTLICNYGPTGNVVDEPVYEIKSKSG